MSIHQQMIDAGQVCHNHETDLYVYVNDVTTAIVNGYRFKSIAHKFRSDDPADGGAMMYDIPFAFDKTLAGNAPQPPEAP